ncbi:MAG: cation diffusion facilitator family transporter [Anaerovibrio sp.]|uniref:cation diffusion facilitator family transporter n=1 Tax=Anaerovibrio sp. TaxID=1872532 RepID=UPI0025F67916|nr:cation diffusion facilitator family transporter [Anaerovibrio sp.]MCR5176590.1 cation diffusion facilitator family transporter [Anaerovibrio sp.]
MFDRIIKLFIKNSEEVNDPKVRTSYGYLSGGAGIVINVLLCGVKMLIGYLSGSIAIIGDAIHNLADAGASVITILGYKLAARPADREHPFGHGRIEYIAGFIIAAAILIIGVELMRSSIDKLINPVPIEATVDIALILSLSLLVQMLLGFFNRRLGKKIDSPAILAAATDSLSDCVATFVVIICLLVNLFIGMDFDAMAGIVVALFIIHSGWGAARDTLQPLLGEPPDPEFVRKITRKVLDEKTIIGIHDVMVHNYGPGRIFVSMHAEVPATMSLLDAHSVVDKLEHEISDECNVSITVHVDPVVENNPIQNEIKNKLHHILGAIDPLITYHDFHITASGYLCFDISVPYNCGFSDERLSEMIKSDVLNEFPGWQLRLKIDRL